MILILCGHEDWDLGCKSCLASVNAIDEFLGRKGMKDY
jgi:hypothetical protein